MSSDALTIDSDRTCYNCQHQRFCLVRYKFGQALDEGNLRGFLDINKQEPLQMSDIYAAVANACVEFVPREEE